MACTPEFIEFVCTELSPLGEVSARKMMGDYIIYLNGKCVIAACDNTAFVKKLPCIAGLRADAETETGCAYKGAKEGYIFDFQDRQKTLRVIQALWEVLPFPKSRKK